MNSKMYNEDQDFKWKKVKKLISDAPDLNVPYQITDNFYLSSYECPNCKSVMYKTVFPVGGEIPIWTEQGDLSLKRVFTCVKCNSFYAPEPLQRLNNGNVFELYRLNQEKYRTLLGFYDKYGTTTGRTDA